MGSEVVLLLFGVIRNPIWPPWPLIGHDTLYFFSAAKQYAKSLDIPEMILYRIFGPSSMAKYIFQLNLSTSIALSDGIIIRTKKDNSNTMNIILKDNSYTQNELFRYL